MRKMCKLLISFLLLLCFGVSAYAVTPTEILDRFYEEKGIFFSDLAGYEWAEEAVIHLAEQGVVSGDGDGTFAPGRPVSRAEFAKLLMTSTGMADSSAVCSFTDVPKEEWFYPFVSSAFQSGITNGVSKTEYAPHDPVTREQMATLIYRAAETIAIPIAEVQEPDFTDQDSISPWAKTAVASLKAYGVFPEQCFRPQDAATRAEVCMAIYALVKNE